MPFTEDERAAMTTWYHRLSDEDLSYLMGTYGGVFFLIDVVVTPVIRAISPFWLPDLSVFRFGTCELTPLPEEYHHLLDGRSTLDLPCSPILEAKARRYEDPWQEEVRLGERYG
jgi:hypothetical protein